MFTRARLMAPCIVVVVTLGTGCPDEKKAVETPVPVTPTDSPATYVGTDKCASCHEDAHDAWLGSHHDLAMQVASPDTVLGDFENVTVDYYDEEAKFTRDGERFFIEARAADGTPRRFEVRYAFGISPMQQYLVETETGRLQAVAFAWDTRPKADGGQRWFHLQPDEYIAPDDPLHWTGLSYNWNHSCADCHSTHLIKGYDRATKRYSTTYEEVNVGCEACHGPGSRHVSLAEVGATSPRGGFDTSLPSHSDRIWRFVPGRDIAVLESSPETDELERCAPCHSRRADLGEAMADYHDRYRLATLDELLYFDDGQIRDEVYVYGSFLQSKMYAAGVICSDCHEPHSARLRAEGNALCTSCHKAEVFDSPSHSFHQTGTPGSACTDCHMPKRTYMVIDARGDHRFGIPRPALSARVGAPDACTGCHTNKSPAWAERQIDRHFPERSEHSFAGAFHAARHQQPEAEGLLTELVATGLAPALVRATAILELGNLRASALPALLMRASTDSSPVVRRAVANASRALPDELRSEITRPLLTDPKMTVRIEAAASLLGVDPRGWKAADRSALTAATAEYRRAREFSADRGDGLVDLAHLELAENEPDRAEALLREAISIDPAFTAAYVNLADLFRALGRNEDSEKVLREALVSAGDQATASHALGLALVRLGKHGEAIPQLRRAYELRPESPRFGYVYAVAMFDQGRQEAALRVLEEVRRRYPANVDVLMALVSYNQRLGHDQAAARHAQTLESLGVRAN